jgi:hypothetical protein
MYSNQSSPAPPAHILMAQARVRQDGVELARLQQVRQSVKIDRYLHENPRPFVHHSHPAMAREATLMEASRSPIPSLRESPRPPPLPLPLASFPPPEAVLDSPVPSQLEIGVPQERIWMTEQVPARYSKKASKVSESALSELTVVKSMKKRSHTQAIPLWHGLKAFAQYNRLPDVPFGELVVLYVVHRKEIRRKLKASSQIVYVSNLRSFAATKFDLSKEDRNVLSSYISMLEVQAMAEPTEHAADVSVSFCTAALKGAPNTKMRITIFMMVVSSARHEDVMHVNSVKLTKNADETFTLIIDFGVRKNMRFKIMQSSVPYKVPKQWIQYVTPKEIEEFDWSCVKREDLKELNKFIKTLDYRAPVKKGKFTGNRTFKSKPTSYSFRRHAIQRFVSENKMPGDKVDWEAVIKMSGHLNDQMPRSVYTKTAREIADLESDVEDVTDNEDDDCDDDDDEEGV